MIPISHLANLAAVLAALLPAAVVGVALGAWLRRRRRASGTFHRQLNGAGVFTCGQCHATWPAANRRDGLATARIHVAYDRGHQIRVRR